MATEGEDVQDARARPPLPLSCPAMPYEVHTPVYEGPFDLLLHLILREQVDLYEVSLARIVDVYIAELEKMDDLDLEVATEFLLDRGHADRAQDQASAAG